MAIASRNHDKAEQYAKVNNIPRFFDSYEDLINDTDIDVIYNSLPNSMHAEWSIKAMQMGKHVLCEKPLATNVKDVNRIIKVAKNTGMVITEAFMYRHHPQTLYVKKMVDDGQIGRVRLIRGSYCYTNTRPDNPRFDPNLGGGSLWDVGCYPVGYARYIIGKDPIEAYGHQVTGPTGIDLVYTGQLLFPDEVIAQIGCSFITPLETSIEIIGDEGRIIITQPYKPGLKTQIYWDRNRHSHKITIKGAELYKGEIEDLENSILSDIPSRISLQDSKANIATIEALYQSARLSKPVTISHQTIDNHGERI
jgi:xylose dehydrogenase (NAD/NADP)